MLMASFLMNMNTLEKYKMYLKTKRNDQITDKSTLRKNVIFDTIVRCENNRCPLSLHCITIPETIHSVCGWPINDTHEELPVSASKITLTFILLMWNIW
jgi:hypothetical protein